MEDKIFTCIVDIDTENNNYTIALPNNYRLKLGYKGKDDIKYIILISDNEEKVIASYNNKIGQLNLKNMLPPTPSIVTYLMRSYVLIESNQQYEFIKGVIGSLGRRGYEVNDIDFFKPNFYKSEGDSIVIRHDGYIYVENTKQSGRIVLQEHGILVIKEHNNKIYYNTIDKYQKEICLYTQEIYLEKILPTFKYEYSKDCLRIHFTKTRYFDVYKNNSELLGTLITTKDSEERIDIAFDDLQDDYQSIFKEYQLKLRDNKWATLSIIYHIIEVISEYIKGKTKYTMGAREMANLYMEMNTQIKFISSSPNEYIICDDTTDILEFYKIRVNKDKLYALYSLNYTNNPEEEVLIATDTDLRLLHKAAGVELWNN